MSESNTTDLLTLTLTLSRSQSTLVGNALLHLVRSVGQPQCRLRMNSKLCGCYLARAVEAVTRKAHKSNVPRTVLNYPE